MAEESGDIRNLVQAVIQEFVKAEQSKAEPAHKAELLEERRRRESLEQRVNELVAENERSRTKAEEAERCAAVRAELQKLGVAKIELAYKAVKDEIRRGDDGRLMATGWVRRAGLSGAICRRESGVAAGAAGRRVRRGGGPEGFGERRGGPGQDQAGHECGGQGTGKAGDCEGGVADAAWNVGELFSKVRLKQEKKWEQLHQQMWRLRLSSWWRRMRCRL